MNSSLTGALAVLGTAGILTNVAAYAHAAHAGASPHAAAIDLVAEQADDDLLDLGQPGFGLGDQLLISDTLVRHGVPVGSSGGTCQVAKVAGSQVTVNCVTTLDLPRGQITVQGLLTVGGDATGPFEAAITGGTDAYRTAHGYMLIEPVDADTERYRLTVVR